MNMNMNMGASFPTGSEVCRNSLVLDFFQPDILFFMLANTCSAAETQCYLSKPLKSFYPKRSRLMMLLSYP